MKFTGSIALVAALASFAAAAPAATNTAVAHPTKTTAGAHPTTTSGAQTPAKHDYDHNKKEKVKVQVEEVIRIKGVHYKVIETIEIDVFVSNILHTPI